MRYTMTSIGRVTYHQRGALVESIGIEGRQVACRLSWVVDAAVTRVGVVPCAVQESRLT